MFWKKWSDKPWYSFTVAGCIIALVFVILLNLGHIHNGFHAFLRLLSPVFIAAVMAFIMNRLSVLYENTILSLIKKPAYRRVVGITLSVITIILFLIFALSILIPQLIDSVTMLLGNLGTYEENVQNYIESLSIFDEFRNSDFYQTIMASGSLPKLIGNYVTDNVNNVISVVATAGKNVIMWVISFILSVYIMAEKTHLKRGLIRLLRALFSPERFNSSVVFLKRCNSILTSYIVYNLVDAIIVGLANAAFMTIAGFPYTGLISFAVAITNLVPTFGPIVGGAIGALLLLLVNPWYALVFLIFTVALQTVDGYIIKPRLFGSTLGVSGLWILIAIIVCGRAFGVVGILAAIPLAAVIDLLYKDYFMPWLEKRRRNKSSEEAAEAAAEQQPEADSRPSGPSADS